MEKNIDISLEDINKLIETTKREILLLKIKINEKQEILENILNELDN